MRALRLSLSLCLSIFATLPATASSKLDWIVPTAAELNSTSDPAAPGAPAIVLSYEEWDDSNSAEVILHVRIKVLTSAGLSAATIELADRIVSNDEFDQQVLARTIHRDGTVIPFVGTPQSNLTTEGEDGRRRVIVMPNVEVGSILEYICHYRSQNTLNSYLIGFYSPVWRVQQRYLTKSAHFTLKVPDDTDPQYVRWVANLPAGTAPQRVKHEIKLDLTDVPSVPDEEMMPPIANVFYRVRFFYYDGTREKYWGTTGDRVDSEWSEFYKPRKGVIAAVHDLVVASNPDEQKLHALYSAVMKLENTDMTRQRGARENKQNGLRTPRNSDDIWEQKRGSSYELAFLFIAMARAAGFEAYPFAVTSRDHAEFDQNVLSWAQLDSMLAIVKVKGVEVFLDPGTRLCPFGRLAPWHSNVVGVSIEGKMIKVRSTPAESFKTSAKESLADLALQADASVTGTLQLEWVGNSGLQLRQLALREDTSAVEEELEKSILAQVPPGVEIKLLSLSHLENGDVPLEAKFSVSGKLGAATQKRLILPSEFLEGASKPLFAPETRSEPIQFSESFQSVDLLRLHLPSELSVETMPDPQQLHDGGDYGYQVAVGSAPAKAASGGSSQDAGARLVLVKRTFALNRLNYPASQYPELHRNFAQIAADDRLPIVLRRENP